MGSLFDIEYFFKSIPTIAGGIPEAMLITVIAFVVGCAIGLVVALLRIYPKRGLTRLAIIYVSFIRGTPLLVQIFLAYYGVPLIFIFFKAGHYVSGISAIWFIYISFSLNVGGYMSETIRAAIVAIPKGQMEAAYSVGMTTTKAMVKIILPQAFYSTLPNLGNQFIMLLKNTSLAFVTSVPEIMAEAKIIAGRTSKFFEVYIVAALLYWAICLVLEQILKRLEAHYGLKR
ncbi:MAG: amino acid ABC transporter permease [Deltaproteobacteria bacterium]|jgi:L-cystine transport system permease protein|nr:amino acid ABC transporter permease [Deltaproteobacteria bacterium]